MQYRIITACNPDDLATLVAKAIDDCWHPLGGVAVVYTVGGERWAQAMIKGS